MSDQDLFPVPAEWAKKARITSAKYDQLYGRALGDPGSFWLEQAKRLTWIKRPEIAGDWSFKEEDFHIRWFSDGKINASANCIDRHLKERGDATAIIWEPDDPSEPSKQLSYSQLHQEVCKFANVLKMVGVAKGDRVTIYMPMIPEAAFAILEIGRAHV